MKAPGAGFAARLAVVAALEIAYVVFTRTWLAAHSEGSQLELLTTSLRLLDAAICGFLFRGLILARRAHVRARWLPLLLAGMASVLLVPVLVGDDNVPPDQQWVFAWTSIVVAVREEFVYRGVLQNLIQHRLGARLAILGSNVVFTLYHYGAQPFTPVGLLELFTMGCILGLIYFGTGSILLCAALHAAYDALWCFVPFVKHPWPPAGQAVLYLAGALLVAIWAWRGDPARALARPVRRT